MADLTLVVSSSVVRSLPPARRAGWYTVMLLATALFSGGWTPAVEAQDPAANQAENVNGVAPGQESDASPNLTMLQWLFKALGWMYTIVFLVLSFVFVALVIMNMLSARQQQICPPELIEGFEARLDEKKYQEAYELAKADESFLGNVLSAGLGKLQSGYEHAIEAMQEVGEEEQMKLDHRLSYIGLIASISPMVGLFGTVDGMIRSFWVIATSGGTPKPSLLAEGVSTALLTTLIGLAIAIPAIAVYNILRNRIQRLVLEVGITSENLMSRFENVGKKP
jgi:biopolymer transport protein ExbB